MDVYMVRLWAVLLVCVAGCSDPPTPGPITTDAPTVDVVSDAGGDTVADMAADAAPDAAPDVVADSVPDAVADTAPDMVADTAPDMVADTAPDAVADTAPDAVADTAPDAVADTAPDAPADTVSDTAADAGPDSDVSQPPNVIEAIPGLWLIGWAGGLDHFDWMRFGPMDPVSGTLDWASPVMEGTLTPWTGCNGVSTWTLAAKPDTIQIDVPDGCTVPPDGSDPIAFTFTFTSDPGWPESAVLFASIELNADPQMYVMAMKYPDDWCTPDLSTCPYPW